MTSADEKWTLLRRLASYRELSQREMMIYCTRLAERGYAYTGGHEMEVECECCRTRVRLCETWSDMEKRLRHQSGCRFEQMVTNLLRPIEVDGALTGPSLVRPIEVDGALTGPSLVRPIEVDGSSTRPSLVMPIEVDRASTRSSHEGAFHATRHIESNTSLEPHSAVSRSYPILQTDDTARTLQDLKAREHQSKEGLSAASASLTSNYLDVFTELMDFPLVFYPEHLGLNSHRELTNNNSDGRKCDKNPGHYAYFNAATLKSEQIPTQFRCIEMLNVLKIMSDLTVRIVVTTTSSHRRNGNQHKVRVGTGFVIEHSAQIKVSKQKIEKSKLKSIKKIISMGKKKNVDLVFIQTSRHLVYNDEEAQNTVVEFFHDGPDRKDIVSLEGKYLLNSTTPGDSQCLLVCECSDSAFVQRLNQLQCEFFAVSERLSLKAKKGMSKKLFMIHHPHGGPKVVSYGDYVTVKYKYELEGDLRQPCLTKLKGSVQVGPDVSVYRKTLFYAADTCPGSCGAPILTFCPRQSEANGDVTFKLDIWMHHGVETSHKLGASVLKECLIEDFHQPRPDALMAHPEEDSDDEDSLGKQKVNSPVYKVISTPSHKEYTSYQSRFDSFRNWEFSHIMKPEYLASSGFFYTGLSDCVRCFQCGLGLRSWKQGDDVITEHEKYRPTCPYLKSLPRGQEDNITGAVASLESSRQSRGNLVLNLLKSENTIMKKQLTCKVCYKSDIKDVFLPCGELYACSECSKLLTHCPSCHKPILATVTVYLT